MSEIEAAALPPATSVFFGGGTPSLLAAPLLLSILDAVPRANGCEVTVECNPETVTAESLAAYRAGGVNRLSFGVQSMVPEVLAGLGREHSPAAVVSAVAAARAAGFETWNADLIYGGAGESLADWRRTIDEVLALDPPHVSAYALTVEAGTPLSRDRSRHPDDDDLAEKYAIVDAAMTASGRPWYEVSNWARPGHECRHNRLYWTGAPYRGIGCAAHSFDGTRRWWNVRTPDRYIDLVGRGLSPEAAGESLDPEDRELELLTLRLRTSDGVPVGALAAEDLDHLDGLVERHGDALVLTQRGRLLANEVALRLRADQPAGGSRRT